MCPYELDLAESIDPVAPDTGHAWVPGMKALPWARGSWLAAVAALLLVAGCDRHAQPSVHPAIYSSRTFVGTLKRAVHGARSDARRIRLLDACALRIDWSDGRVRTYDLLRVETSAPRGGQLLERHALALRHGGGRARHVLLQADRWGPLTMAVSSLSHLRGLCARSLQEGPTGDRPGSSQGATAPSGR